MALRSGRINNFIKIWYIVASKLKFKFEEKQCELERNFLVLMIGSFLAPKWQYFLLNDSFEVIPWYPIPFLLEAVEANQCFFFLNGLIKLKFLNHLKPLFMCANLIVNIGPFLWNGSSKTNPFCWRLSSPADFTFWKPSW